MVLLVVDTQKEIMNSNLYEYEKVTANISFLISKAREYNVEVIYVQHDDGPGSGFSKGDEAFEIYEDFAPLKDEKVFYKTVNSAFYPDTGLVSYLTEKNEKQIIVVGLQTDYCIDATVKSGFEHGYEIIIPEYSNSTTDNKYFTKETAYHFYNDFMWPDRYAKCIAVDKAVNLLIQNSKK